MVPLDHIIRSYQKALIFVRLTVLFAWEYQRTIIILSFYFHFDA